jgi:hypothetical protein
MNEKIFKKLKDDFHKLIPKHDLKIAFESRMLVQDHWQPDFQAIISSDNWKFKIAGEIVSRMSYSMLKDEISHLKHFVAQDKKLVPVIVASYLSPDRIKLCRDSGVFFIDLSGNVYLEYCDLYIERIGFPNKFPEERMERYPFSDKASLIIREIISERGKAWGVREIAESVGLNPGYVSRMSKELVRRNYLVRINNKLNLNDPVKILDDWVHHYNYKKNEMYKYFCLAKNPDEIIYEFRKINFNDEVEYAFSFHAGANLISKYVVYNNVYLYVKSHSDIEIMAEKLQLKIVEEGSNIIFLIPYYKNSVFYNKQKIENLWVVSDLQLYIDLYNFPVRGKEQAEHILKRMNISSEEKSL